MLGNSHAIFKINIFILLSVIYLYAGNSRVIEVLQPPNYTVFEKDNTTITVRVDSDVDILKFITEGGDLYKIDIQKGRDTYCQTISLEYGLNTVIIRAYGNGKKISQKKIKLFYKFPTHRRYKYPPENFKKHYFHTDRNEKRCSKCHKMDSNEEEGLAFEDPKDSNCYTCHKSLFKGKKYAHAPSINWVCNVCHKKGNRKNTKYPTPKPLDKVCFSCHKKFYEKLTTKRYKHAPVVEGKCDRCHDVHATPNKYFTRLKVQQLCVTCHGDKISTMKSSGSKCEASDELSCTKCHNPHASDKLFLYEPNRQQVQKKEKKGLWIDE